MKVSLNWLQDYFSDKLQASVLETKFNLMSQEVDGLYKLVDASHLVIGYVESCVKHDNADKLNVCQINVGQESLQIICGAPNIRQGQKVIVALVGAVLPGDFKIKKAKIRGVESHGMVCSLTELGVEDFEKEEDGIYVLDESAQVGGCPLEYMGLDDWVLDLDLTANRPDLLAMRGIAYDVKAMLDLEMQLKTPKVKRQPSNQVLNIYTETKNAPMYYGQLIKNVTIKKSPYWLRARLLAGGIRPINNVVDITNYVMLEYSQPLHAFDFDKIGTDTILVRQAKDKEEIITLDDVKRHLLETDIVITNGEKPIALAGVMGGRDSEVSDQTTTILLESAVFNPVSVRKTSKRLALKSEASSRFEKGINADLTKEAMDMACEMFVSLCDAEIVGQASYYNELESNQQVLTLSLAKLNKVTGHQFLLKDVKDILRRLSFDFKEKNQVFDVEIPSRRIGFESYQDLIEEIVRIYGYDKIGVTLPTTATEGKLTKKQAFKRKLRNHLTTLGFYETNTYTLTNKETAIKYDREDISLVEIMNPLNKDRGFLRHSTIPALTDVLLYNQARKIENVFLYEIGKRFAKNDELELLSGLMYGDYQYSLWQKEETKVDFYLLKGVLENIFDRWNIKDYHFSRPQVNIPNLHPGISAEIYINDVYLGWVGRLHPKEEQALGLSHVFVFEFALDPLYNAYVGVDKEFKAISKYPSVSRDIAVVVDDVIDAHQLITTVKSIGSKSLKDVYVFDVYQGQHLEKGKKSIAMTLLFENKEKTLETAEVDNMVNRIVSGLEKQHQAILRK